MLGKKTINPQTCERCPHRTAAAGCPCWIGEQAGFLETNVVTGDQRFITGCFYQVIPKLMVELIKASNRPAAAIESTRNEMSRCLTMIARSVTPMGFGSGVAQLEQDAAPLAQLARHDEGDGG